MSLGENSKVKTDMLGKKDVLTTGQVAKICNVAPRTVSKWFDSGQLRGYRIPGSKDRRIPMDQLIRFMRAHGIPLNGIDGASTRVLLIDKQLDVTETLADALDKEDRFDVRIAECGFDAGVIAEQFRPHIILLDIMLDDINIKRISAIIRENPELQGTRIVAMATGLTQGESQALLQQGFDAILPKPFDLRQLIQCIDETISIIH